MTLILKTTLFVCLAMQSFFVHALTSNQRQDLYESEVVDIQQNSKFYYKIGGARPMNYPATNYTSFNMGGILKFGAGYSCGNFDPFLTVDNFLGDLDADKVMNYAESTLTGLITGLPLLYLQRNHPDIYQMFQNNIYRAEEIFKLESKSCEQVESDIAAGKNPYKDWGLFSQGTNLQEKTTGSTPVAADSVMEEVKEDAGDKGVYLPKPGVGVTKMGGKNQSPIDMTRIGSIAGYNAMLQRPEELLSVPRTSTQRSTELVRTFNRPEALEDWTKETIGYTEIFTTDDPSTTPRTSPGKGILTQASENQVTVRENLSDALATKSSLERQELLDNLASSGMMITEDLANRINNNPAKPLIIDALSAEIALNQEIDKALLARRALLTALSSKNIASTTVATEAIEKDIKKIEVEIDRAMFEYRLRKELISDLAREIYESGDRPVRRPKEPSSNSLPSFQ